MAGAPLVLQPLVHQPLWTLGAASDHPSMQRVRGCQILQLWVPGRGVGQGWTQGELPGHSRGAKEEVRREVEENEHESGEARTFYMLFCIFMFMYLPSSAV